MACPRCGSDCSCACSGDPIPLPDWRRQVALQVRAHRVRKRHRLDPNSPQLEFDDQVPLHIEEGSTATTSKSSWRWEEGILSTALAPGRAVATDSVQLRESEVEVAPSRNEPVPSPDP